MPILKKLISLSVAATLMLAPLAMGATYTVGGPNGGWDESTNLKAWTASQSFSVGDNLIFQYAPRHDVMEVSKADYDACQAGSPISVYSGGSTSVPLSSPGSRYFICGTPGHCVQGMKMEINVLATAGASPAASPRSSLATSPAIAPTASLAPEATRISPTPVAGVSPLLPPESPLASPTDIPSIETPGMSPSSFGSSQQPSASSANRGIFRANLALGLSLVMMIVLIQAI